MADSTDIGFTEKIPDPINTIDELPGLLSYWNEEICVRQQNGKSYIYSVIYDDDEKCNLVWFKETALAPVPPAKVLGFPITSSGEDRRPAILEEGLATRSAAIAIVGTQPTWVFLLDPIATHNEVDPTETFKATTAKVFNRGSPRISFLQELVAWGKRAPDSIFVDQPGNTKDVYASVVSELGPFGDITHRKACMLEVMRVLAGFESSWNWNEGIDTTRKSATTPKNAEAGAWQVSADSLSFGQDLKDLMGGLNGVDFQRTMKSNHPLSMEYITRLTRHTRMHNGPLYKGSERSIFRPTLRGEEQSIYPWLSRAAVAEFQRQLAFSQPPVEQRAPSIPT
jgi:hypothetical protein